MRKALLTGITGQDGSYMSELLLHKGYEVHGIIRRASTFNTHRIDHLYEDPHDNPNAKLRLHYGDLSESGLLADIIYNIQPDEIYHFGAQSHVRVSFDMPEYTGNITGLGTLRLLEAVRRSGIKTKIFIASSSEMFGSAPAPQNELTPFSPRSPYAAAKLYSYWVAVNYRDSYNLHVTNGILFNHESPRRGETFVTRKITRAISSILSGKQNKLFLGNLDAKRDWGFAPEYCRVIWIMLQNDKPDDFVIGTSHSHSVREFVESAFNYCGIEIKWNKNDSGYISSFNNKWKSKLKIGDVIVDVDKRYLRPTDVQFLQADITKARKLLSWEPKILFNDLVKIMMDYDLLSQEIEPPGEGIKKLSGTEFDWIIR